jgi:uncharacterized coiled-coil protein SlyX
MSLAHKAAINELRERVDRQEKLVDAQAHMIDELYQRIEKIEQRSKPGPKPLSNLNHREAGPYRTS